MKGLDGIYPLDTDTGYKSVASGLGTGWTADTAVARRYGNVVNVIVKNLDYSTGGDTTALTLPTGYRPDFAVSFLVHDGTNAVVCSISTAGVIAVPTAEDDVEINVTYMVTTPWPSL